MSETCFLCTCPEENVQNDVQKPTVKDCLTVEITNNAGGMYNDAQMRHVRPEHDARLWGEPENTIVLSKEKYDAFEKMLEEPPKDLPKLRESFSVIPWMSA